MTNCLPWEPLRQEVLNLWTKITARTVNTTRNPRLTMIAVTGLPAFSESETRGFARGACAFTSVTEEEDSVESTFVEEEDKLPGVVSASTSFFGVDIVVVVVFTGFSCTHLTLKSGSCCQLVVVVFLFCKAATCH